MLKCKNKYFSLEEKKQKLTRIFFFIRLLVISKYLSIFTLYHFCIVNKLLESAKSHLLLIK